MFETILIFISLLFLVASAEETPDYYNPYAPIFTDKEVYTWTDKIQITIVAPSWNSNKYSIDDIGSEEEHFIKISTTSHSLKPYKLTETEPNNGIFSGEVILTGFLHDVDGDGDSDTIPRTTGNGPTNGFLETDRDDAITISFEFADGVVLTHSAMISWNIGEIIFSEPVYLTSETAKIQITDPDMNLNPETVDQIAVTISSDSDVAGILVDAIETTDNSGLFEASILFTQNLASSGNRLFANPSDVLYAKYDDYTLPKPFSKSDNLEIKTTSKLVSDIPPLDRIAIDNSFIADRSGNLISDPTINEQFQIVGAVANNQNYKQPFVFIIQIKEQDESVALLSWIQGELTPNQNLELSQSWTPIKSGNYTIETYVWNSFKDSIPLSPINKQSFFIE